MTKVRAMRLCLLATLLDGGRVQHHSTTARPRTRRCPGSSLRRRLRSPTWTRVSPSSRPVDVSLEGLPTSTEAPDFLGFEGQMEGRAPVLSLEKALETAVQHSRVYQSRKEQVYLQALSLSLARHQFAPLFSAGGSADYVVSTVEVQGFEVDPSTGQPRPVTSDTLVERSSVEGHGSVNASWLIRDVGRISAAFTKDFFRFLAGDPSTVNRSQLSATFTRPLLLNAGFKAEMENLTLAEREMLYSLRDFVRFRKQFSIDVAAAYYRVLQNRDAARNTYLGFQSFRKSAARTRALVDEGRVKLAELGRLEQQELSQETSWIAAIRNYKLALDNLKIQLGLSTDANIVLDEKELQGLTILHPDISAEDAIRVALASRLDLQNLRNQVEDAKRAVALAANGLLPQVDLTRRGQHQQPAGQAHGLCPAGPRIAIVGVSAWTSICRWTRRPSAIPIEPH